MPEANRGKANNQRQCSGNSGKPTQNPWEWYWPVCGAAETPPSAKRAWGDYSGRGRTKWSKDRATTTSNKCVMVPGLPARQQAAKTRGSLETEARKVKRAIDGTSGKEGLEVITHPGAPPGLASENGCTPGPLETDTGWKEAAGKKKDAWELAEQRRLLSAKAYERKLQAIISLQSAWRGRVARCTFANACAAIVLLQDFWRKRRCGKPGLCANGAEILLADELAEHQGVAKAKPEPKRKCSRNRGKTKGKRGTQLEDDDLLKEALLQAQSEKAALGAAAKLEALALEPVIAKQRAVCPEGHPLLAKAVTVAEGKACWKCRALFPAGSSEASCFPCDFSLCKGCVGTFGGGEGGEA